MPSTPPRAVTSSSPTGLQIGFPAKHRTEGRQAHLTMCTTGDSSAWPELDGQMPTMGAGDSPRRPGAFLERVSLQKTATCRSPYGGSWTPSPDQACSTASSGFGDPGVISRPQSPTRQLRYPAFRDIGGWGNEGAEPRVHGRHLHHSSRNVVQKQPPPEHMVRVLHWCTTCAK
jgi:hypothetical protein